MIYRKTWFSYVLWFLYTVLCVILVSVVGSVWTQYFTGISIISPQIIYGLSVIPAAALYWIIRVIAARIRKKYVWKERTLQIMAAVFFVLIMVGGILIRIACLTEYVWSIRDLRILTARSTEYYDMAVVTEQGVVSPMDYGIEYLYVMLLSFTLSLLGNKVASAIFLQIILQVIGLILVYAVTRKLARRLPACAALLYMTGSLCCLNMLVHFGPEWLYFNLYMVGMLMAVVFVKNYCADKIPKPTAVICALAVGALIGALTYLDLVGASILVVMLIAAVGKKTESEETAYYNFSKGMNAAVISCSVLSCAAVWCGAVYAAAYAKGTYFLADITERMRLCYQGIYPQFPYNMDVELVGFLIIPAAFLIFEFFRSGKMQNFMPWILLCLIAAPTPLSIFGEHGFAILSMYIWAVLAGLGLQNCLFGGEAKVMQAMIEEINTAAEKAEQSASVGQTTEAQESEQADDQAPKSRYIENPLPLPKKHVAKEMDYQYDVAEKDMKYDLFVPDNDDYDIQ